MKRFIFTTGVLLSTGVCAAAPVNWASTVVTPGVNTNGWNGKVDAFAGSYSSHSYTVTPFDAAFTTTSSESYGAPLLAVTPGQSLELQFSGTGFATTSSAVNGGFTIGIQAGVGLADINYPNGQTGNPAADYNNPRSAIVAVSQDGSTWKYLQYNGVTGTIAVEPNPTNPSLYQWVDNSASASLIQFDIPTNYYNSSSVGPDGNYAPDTVSAGTPVADFSKPFLGTLASFNNESWSQVLDTLDGSAGGTWLNVTGTGFSSIDYVQFTVPSSASYSMYVQAVAGVVPEPGTLALVLAGIPLLLGWRRRDLSPLSNGG